MHRSCYFTPHSSGLDSETGRYDPPRFHEVDPLRDFFHPKFDPEEQERVLITEGTDHTEWETEKETITNDCPIESTSWIVFRCRSDSLFDFFHLGFFRVVRAFRG